VVVCLPACAIVFTGHSSVCGFFLEPSFAVEGAEIGRAGLSMVKGLMVKPEEQRGIVNAKSTTDGWRSG
jgi:hypothetical protein